jgi:hypothetical protein
MCFKAVILLLIIESQTSNNDGLQRAQNCDFVTHFRESNPGLSSDDLKMFQSRVKTISQEKALMLSNENIFHLRYL